MSTSIMIHGVASVHSSGVFYENDNSVSIEIATKNSGSFSLTLFGLPKNDADYLADSLAPAWTRKSEEEIRADERRKIAETLGVAS